MKERFRRKGGRYAAEARAAPSPKMKRRPASKSAFCRGSAPSRRWQIPFIVRVRSPLLSLTVVSPWADRLRADLHVHDSQTITDLGTVPCGPLELPH